MSNKKAPTHLTHKPIYAVNDYDTMDGHYKNNSDVHALSIGRAQWDSSEFVPSVKVWRQKDGRWSRQSEETTLTRALDMATLVIKIINHHYNGKEIEAINTVFGSIPVETVNTSLISELDKSLGAEKDDINAHVEMLRAALAEYK